MSLTGRGRRAALRVVRRHRLLETFLVSELGMGWGQVHDEAEALEHAISDRLLAAIAAKLGDPARDPHGDPIPRPSSRSTRPRQSRSTGCRSEQRALVRILDANAALLGYLDGLGVSLGDEVEVLGLEPFGGPFTVSIDGRKRSLGRLAAAALSVESRA